MQHVKSVILLLSVRFSPDTDYRDTRHHLRKIVFWGPGSRSCFYVRQGLECLTQITIVTTSLAILNSVQHELQRWSLINIPSAKKNKRLRETAQPRRKPKHKVQLPSVPTSGVASIYPTYCPCSFLLIILKQDFIRSDLAISDCLRRLIHFSDPKVKI